MKVSVDLKMLKKMMAYLSPIEFAIMMNAIIEYAEDGTECEFPNKTMKIIWDDVKPDVERSRKSFHKWLTAKIAEEADRKMETRDENIVNNNYVGRVEDLNDNIPAPF